MRPEQEEKVGLTKFERYILQNLMSLMKSLLRSSIEWAEMIAMDSKSLLKLPVIVNETFVA